MEYPSRKIRRFFAGDAEIFRVGSGADDDAPFGIDGRVGEMEPVFGAAQAAFFVIAHQMAAMALARGGLRGVGAPGHGVDAQGPFGQGDVAGGNARRFGVVGNDDVCIVGALGHVQMRVPGEILRGDPEADDVGGDEAFVILGVLLEHGAEKDLRHERPLGVAGEDEGPPAVQVLHVIGEGGGAGRDGTVDHGFPVAPVCAHQTRHIGLAVHGRVDVARREKSRRFVLKVAHAQSADRRVVDFTHRRLLTLVIFGGNEVKDIGCGNRRFRPQQPGITLGVIGNDRHGRLLSL